MLQESTRDSIEFKDDPNAELVDKLAADLGLRKVGLLISYHFISLGNCLVIGEKSVKNENAYMEKCS